MTLSLFTSSIPPLGQVFGCGPAIEDSKYRRPQF
jgi:hypothetical protein